MPLVVDQGRITKQIRSAFSLVSKHRLKQNVFSLLRKESVDRRRFRSVVSLFHARGAATEKVLSPIHRHVRGMMRLPHDKAHRADRASNLREKWQLNINCSTITSHVSIMNDNCQAVMAIIAARCNDLDVQQFQQPLCSVGISNLISYQ